METFTALNNVLCTSLNTSARGFRDPKYLQMSTSNSNFGDLSKSVLDLLAAVGFSKRTSRWVENHVTRISPLHSTPLHPVMVFL
jgi:hypothetical protein